MAGDRARDLTFRILSDTSRLETDKAAADLDDLADAAKDAGDGLGRLDQDTDQAASGLDKVERAAKDAGDSLDRLDKDVRDVDLGRLEKEAEDTAKAVDNAFDRIRRSSSASTKAVDDDVRKAGDGFDNFREEANSTARESAASFSGSFDDVAGSIQEVAANAFAGFGPAGAAAGLLAAAGIGIVVTKMQEAKERVKELAGEIIDAGGKIGTDGIFARISEAATEGDLDKLARSARLLGIDVSDLSSIFADSASARAFLDTLDGIATAQETVNRVTGRGVDVAAMMGDTQERTTDLTRAQMNALNTLREAAGENAREFEKAEKIARDYEAVTGHSLETVERFTDAIQGLTDQQEPYAQAVEDAAKRQADATKSQEDSWQDYADTAIASIDDVIARQLDQLAAADAFETNMSTVFDRLGQDAVDWALSQGESADEAMALLANAPIAKGKQVAANYRRAADQAGGSYADGLASKEDAILAAAEKGHWAAVRALGKTITVPVELEDVSRAARIAWGEADAYFRNNPITLRTKGPSMTGQRPVRDYP